MKVAVIREPGERETRVAVSPETAKKFVGAGLGVVIESGAGARARFSDDEYREVGAEVVSGADAALEQADLLLLELSALIQDFNHPKETIEQIMDIRQQIAQAIVSEKEARGA